MTIKASLARTATLMMVLFIAATSVPAQTVMKLAKNKYSPKQDAEIGREAAAEIRKEYPIIEDKRIAGYLDMLGDRLVAVAPAELKDPAYEYSFTPVNLKEINAFALPGGPMFVHRGMFDAAAEEGEVVGVMAHELSHVLLRHGTANASKAQNPWLQIGQMAGMIGGAMMGGATGSAIAQGSQLGLSALLTKYSRDFEKQADLLGAQIMARAGYDPRALAHMFQTIERESGGGGGTPEWLSSHPNPGNRTQYITKEAETLTIGVPADDSGFQPIKAAFASLPPAKTMEELARASKPAGNEQTLRSLGNPGQPVPAPSTQYQRVSGGQVFQAAVPSNWTSLPSDTAIRVVPENGYGDLNGRRVFSHGLEFGIAKAQSRDLVEATNAWLSAVAQSNPELRLAGQQREVQISQRPAIGTPLVNPSPLGGQERIGLYTTFVGNGTLFYYLTIVPENDAAAFEETFRRVGQSIQFGDGR
jgi:Zn-dependent protease with chaperone function